MSRIDEMAESARSQGVRPWVGVKERLAAEVIRVMADEPRVVLQGGAALHFVYGSPRLSADVDFVGEGAARALTERGEGLARAVGDLLVAPARWSSTHAGRLTRGKITVEIDAARRLVLPVEVFEVPAHHVRRDAQAGNVEEATEIAADKIVASADRLAKRGALKTRDLFDLWYLRVRLQVPSPSKDLVLAKAGDYGYERHGNDLAGAARAISREELRQSLEGVLPASALQGLDLDDVTERAASILQEFRDAL